MSGLHIPQSIDCFAQFQGFASLNWVNPVWAIKNTTIDDGEACEVLSGDRWRHLRPLLFPCGFCIAFSLLFKASGFPT
tara:strand:- start:773 stop:1006 length:234 start_codon:yes stop_codon:yes gene_type:complete